MEHLYKHVTLIYLFPWLIERERERERENYELFNNAFNQVHQLDHVNYVNGGYLVVVVYVIDYKIVTAYLLLISVVR